MAPDKIKNTTPSGISRVLLGAGFPVLRTGLPRHWGGIQLGTHHRGSVSLYSAPRNETLYAYRDAAEVAKAAVAHLRDRGYVVSYIPGTCHAVIGPAASTGSNTEGTPLTEAPEPTRYATREVVKSLFTDIHGGKCAWQKMSLVTLEDFTRDAKVWLPENADLKAATIENADFSEVLAYFRWLADWKAPEPEAEAAPEQRPGYSKVPGLDVWVKDREDETEAPAPVRKSRVKVRMTKEGIPTGRYAIETVYGLEFFWIKIEGAKFMEHTTVRKLMHDGKWRMFYGGVNKVLELIKQAGWEAASRYGEIKNTCAICGRPLTVSAIKGIGPECEQEVGENPFDPKN